MVTTCRTCGAAVRASGAGLLDVHEHPLGIHHVDGRPKTALEVVERVALDDGLAGYRRHRCADSVQLQLVTDGAS